MKRYFIEQDYIAEAVNQVNKLYEWVNKAVPELIPIIENAQITKNGFDISKKDRALIKPILDTKPFRAYLSIEYGDVHLKADITFPVKVGVQYFEVNVCLGGNAAVVFEPYQPLFVDKVKAQIDQYKGALRQFDELESEIYDMAHKLSPFFGN